MSEINTSWEKTGDQAGGRIAGETLRATSAFSTVVAAKHFMDGMKRPFELNEALEQTEYNNFNDIERVWFKKQLETIGISVPLTPDEEAAAETVRKQKEEKVKPTPTPAVEPVEVPVSLDIYVTNVQGQFEKAERDSKPFSLDAAIARFNKKLDENQRAELKQKLIDKGITDLADPDATPATPPTTTPDAPQPARTPTPDATSTTPAPEAKQKFEVKDLTKEPDGEGFWISQDEDGDRTLHEKHKSGKGGKKIRMKDWDEVKISKNIAEKDLPSLIKTVSGVMESLRKGDGIGKPKNGSIEVTYKLGKEEKKNSFSTSALEFSTDEIENIAKSTNEIKGIDDEDDQKDAMRAKYSALDKVKTALLNSLIQQEFKETPGKTVRVEPTAEEAAFAATGYPEDTLDDKEANEAKMLFNLSARGIRLTPKQKQRLEDLYSKSLGRDVAADRKTRNRSGANWEFGLYRQEEKIRTMLYENMRKNPMYVRFSDDYLKERAKLDAEYFVKQKLEGKPHELRPMADNEPQAEPRVYSQADYLMEELLTKYEPDRQRDEEPVTKKKKAKKTPPPLPVEDVSANDPDIKEEGLQKFEPKKPSIAELRDTAAKAEAEYHALELRWENLFGLTIGGRKEKQAAAKKEYEAAKAKYELAFAEVAAQSSETWLNEQSAELKARGAELGKKFKARSWLSEKWEALGQWNLLEKIGIGESWQKANEQEVLWDSKKKLNSAWEKFQMLVSRGAYSMFSARSLISFALLGGAGYSLAEGSAEAFTAFAGTRTAMATIGGYQGGKAASRALMEWGAERDAKKTLRSTQTLDKKTLTKQQDELVNARNVLLKMRIRMDQMKERGQTVSQEYNDLLKKFAVQQEKTHKLAGIEARKEALEGRRATIEASYLLSGGRGPQAEKLLEEFRAINRELGLYLATSVEVARCDQLEGQIAAMRQDTQLKTNAAIARKKNQAMWSKIVGLSTGALFGIFGLGRNEEGLAAIEKNNLHPTGISYPEKTLATGWQPGQEASSVSKPTIDQISTWPDAAKNQPAVAEQLSRALDTNVPVRKLESIAAANHLIERPADFKAAMGAAVSIEIDADNNTYGTALESALGKLAEVAKTDAAAAATLTKFFTSVNMGSVDVTDLDEADIHKAMLKKVGFHGAHGEVAEDVKNKVHFKNRLIITSDGTVDVIQGAGKEAPTTVNEIEFAKNLARRVGADPNSVSFKNGWHELGMKLRGQEISIKNPFDFEGYNAVRAHTEAQIAQKTTEIAQENPLRDLIWSKSPRADVFANLTDTENFKSFLTNTEGATQYGVAELSRELLPNVPDDTRVFAIDIGSIDARPERFGVAVASEEQPGKSIAAETLQPSGTPKEVLKDVAAGAVTVRENIKWLEDDMRLTRDQVIEFAHLMGESLDSNAASFETFVAQTRTLHEKLGRSWTPIMDGMTWDKTQMKIVGAIGDYSGNQLQSLLAAGKTMTKLSLDQKIAALDILGSTSPKALGALLDVEKVATLTNTATSYDASQRILIIKNIAVNGESIKSITIDTSLGNVTVDPGFWSRTKTGKLDSIQKLFVR